MERPRLLRRRVALVALAVLVAPVASACSGTAVGPSPLATVGDAEITQAQVDAQIELELEYQRAAAELQGADEAGIDAMVAEFDGAGADTVPTTKAADALTTLVQLEILTQAVTDAGGEITDADRETARSSVEGGYEQQGIALDDIPSAYLDQQIEFAAAQAALQSTIEVPQEELEAAFAAQVDNYTQLCVSVILTTDQAAAEAARQRIVDGEEFATVAAEVSEDPQTREAGGEAGCAATADVAGSLGPAIYDAVVNVPIEPYEVQGGWVVTMVTSRQVPELADVADQLLPQLQGPRVSEVVQPLVDDVVIDPRVGTWNTQSASVTAPTVQATPETIPAEITAETVPTAGA